MSDDESMATLKRRPANFAATLVGRPLRVAALLLCFVACNQRRPEGDAIVVGMANPVINLQGVLFHNGRELTSADVVYTFRSFLDPNFRGRSGAQAAVIQRDLAQVGIAVDVRSTELATLLGDVVKGSFEMYTLQFVGVTDPDMLRRVFRSGQQPPAGLNRVHYSNADVDRLIEQAASAVDDTARRVLYTKAQQIIASDVPYISLWYKTNVAVFQPGIRGVRLSPIADFTFLKDVYRDAPPSSARR